MDKRLLEIIACPICKGKLKYDEAGQRLLCSFDQLAYPVRDGIPVMLVDEAEPLNQEPKNKE